MKTIETVAFGIGIAGFFGSMALALEADVEAVQARPDASIYVSMCEYANKHCKEAMEMQSKLDGDTLRMVIGGIGFVAIASQLSVRLKNIELKDKVETMEMNMLNMEAALLMEGTTVYDDDEADPEDETSDDY